MADCPDVELGRAGSHLAVFAIGRQVLGMRAVGLWTKQSCVVSWDEAGPGLAGWQDLAAF